MAIKHHDTQRHPGPWRVMRLDSELAGILIAIGFALLGVVGLPIGKWFLLAAILLGLAIALLLRLRSKKKAVEVELDILPQFTSVANNEGTVQDPPAASERLSNRQVLSIVANVAAWIAAITAGLFLMWLARVMGWSDNYDVGTALIFAIPVGLGLLVAIQLAKWRQDRQK